MITFSIEKSNFLGESLTCKVSNISITYLLFFLTAGYMALTVRNLKIFSGPKDFKNVFFVRSKKIVFFLFLVMSGITCLLGQSATMLCHNICFPVYTLCMTVMVSHVLILLANFKIANEIRKDCEFSIAMESEESESASANNNQNNKEKFQGSFCIYRSSKRDKRKRWRGRRRRQKGRRTQNDEKESKGKSLHKKKSMMVNENDIFEDENIKSSTNKVMVVKPRKQRYTRQAKHSIRGIRISFGPKTHSQDSISTQTSESPNQSRNSGLNEFSSKNESDHFNRSENEPNLNISIEDNFNKGKNFETKIDFHENSNLISNFENVNSKENSVKSGDSIDDLEEFELEFDDEFKTTIKKGFSFYATPTKCLDKEFRNVCLSDKKEIENW
jgi:hypothetical protein